MVCEVVPDMPKARPASSPRIARGSVSSPMTKEAPGTRRPSMTATAWSGVYQCSPVRTVAHHRAATRSTRQAVTIR